MRTLASNLSKLGFRREVYLYILYTADIPVTKFAETVAFAAKLLLKNLHKTVNKLIKWVTKWKDHLNSSKTIHMVFALRQYYITNTILSGEKIPIKPMLNTSVHLDSRLNWRKHIVTEHEEIKIRFRIFSGSYMLGTKFHLQIKDFSILQ